MEGALFFTVKYRKWGFDATNHKSHQNAMYLTDEKRLESLRLPTGSSAPCYIKNLALCSSLLARAGSGPT